MIFLFAYLLVVELETKLVTFFLTFGWLGELTW